MLLPFPVTRRKGNFDKERYSWMGWNKHSSTDLQQANFMMDKSKLNRACLILDCFLSTHMYHIKGKITSLGPVQVGQYLPTWPVGNIDCRQKIHFHLVCSYGNLKKWIIILEHWICYKKIYDTDKPSSHNWKWYSFFF